METGKAKIEGSLARTLARNAGIGPNPDCRTHSHEEIIVHAACARNDAGDSPAYIKLVFDCAAGSVQFTRRTFVSLTY